MHSWIKNGKGPLIELGKYQEPFRQFLLREKGFPERAALVIGVTPPEKAVIGFNMPQLRGTQPYHSYLFYIPGIVFALQVGKGVTAFERNVCFFSSPLHPIVLTDLSNDIYRFVGKRVRKAKKSADVLHFMNARGRK